MGTLVPFIINKMWENILRDKYSLPIMINWKIKRFKYDEFTLKECLEFHYKQEDEVVWLFNFLNTHWKEYTIFWKICIYIWNLLKSIFIKKHTLTQEEFLSLDLVKLFDQIRWSAMKWFYSRGDWEKQEWPTPPTSSFIDFLCERYWFTVEQVLSMTKSQMDVLSDWSIWNLNNMSEKWQKENKQKMHKEYYEKNKDRLENTFAKLRKHNGRKRIKT